MHIATASDPPQPPAATLSTNSVDRSPSLWFALIPLLCPVPRCLRVYPLKLSPVFPPHRFRARLRGSTASAPLVGQRRGRICAWLLRPTFGCWSTHPPASYGFATPLRARPAWSTWLCVCSQSHLCANIVASWLCSLFVCTPRNRRCPTLPLFSTAICFLPLCNTSHAPVVPITSPLIRPPCLFLCLVRP